MKKIFYAFLFMFFLVTAGFAADKSSVNAGMLTYLGTTEEEFQNGLDDLRKAVAPLIPTEEDKSEWAEYDRFDGFLDSLVKTRRIVRFYDSLLSMQMALRSHKIEEMTLPEPVGLYLISNNSKYDILFSLNMMPTAISFGFKRGNVALQKEFNKAIASMKKDGTLASLQKNFVTELPSSEPPEVKFTTFKDAKTIRVAVTGDLPPIDFIAADGRPTGYNTAILSEIGKRIKANIRLVSIEAGARSAALMGGRVDVVFWYRSSEGIKIPKQAKGKNLKNVMKDNFEGVILSDPYYEWDTDLIIGLSN